MAFFVKVNAVSDEEGGANARTQPQNGPGGDHFTFFRDFLSILQKPAVHDTPRKMPSKMSEVRNKHQIFCHLSKLLFTHQCQNNLIVYKMF